MGVTNIIRGHINEGVDLLTGRHNSMFEYRMAICKECPLYKETKVGPLCNPNLYLNPSTNEVSSEEKEGFHKGCGCRLNAKTRDTQSHCIVNKW